MDKQKIDHIKNYVASKIMTANRVISERLKGVDYQDSDDNRDLIACVKRDVDIYKEYSVPKGLDEISDVDAIVNLVLGEVNAHKDDNYVGDFFGSLYLKKFNDALDLGITFEDYQG